LAVFLRSENEISDISEPSVKMFERKYHPSMDAEEEEHKDKNEA